MVFRVFWAYSSMKSGLFSFDCIGTGHRYVDKLPAKRCLDGKFLATLEDTTVVRTDLITGATRAFTLDYAVKNIFMSYGTVFIIAENLLTCWYGNDEITRIPVEVEFINCIAGVLYTSTMETFIVVDGKLINTTQRQSIVTLNGFYNECAPNIFIKADAALYRKKYYLDIETEVETIRKLCQFYVVGHKLYYYDSTLVCTFARHSENFASFHHLIVDSPVFHIALENHKIYDSTFSILIL